MRPTVVPDGALWPGSQRIVVAAPNGDLTDPEVAPVEAVVDMTDMDGGQVVRLSVRCALEPGDLEKLAAGGHVWLSFLGRLPVFSVTVTDGDGQ